MESENERWSAGKVASEGQHVIVGGINPWNHDWIRLDEPPVELPHPAHARQQHRFWLYRIDADNREIVFAAGELSANVWGFYERLR